MTPTAIIKGLLDSDPDPRPSDWTKTGRQFAVMDAKGNYDAYTGAKATSWAGNKGGKYCTAQGNILAGEGVVAGMVDAFEKTEGHLSMRLMAALDAGQAAGGDKRGMQSAAMLIVEKNGGVWVGSDGGGKKERRRVVDHRFRPAPAGRRQGGASQGTAPRGREMEYHTAPPPV